jgi:8-oxo-dGTP diphosphatase
VGTANCRQECCTVREVLGRSGLGDLRFLAMSFLTSAVAAIIVDPAGNVLLCQQSQGHRLWGLPGGKIRPGESPVHAAIRDIREETGAEIGIVDLVGIYTLTGPAGTGADDLPDVLVHVFRGEVTGGDVAVNAPGRICRLAWHAVAALPEPLTATSRAAIADALAGRSGVLHEVMRSPEPVSPDATDDASPVATDEILVGSA